MDSNQTLMLFCMLSFLSKGCNSVHGIRKTFHTSTSLDKRQSPRTVGIPAWRKASIDRKEFVAKLRKPKSEETIKAEMRLEKQEKDLSLFTSSRIRNLAKEKETVNRSYLSLVRCCYGFIVLLLW